MTYVINQLPNAAALSIVKSFKSHQKNWTIVIMSISTFQEYGNSVSG